MTADEKISIDIDQKIDHLGEYGCRKFLEVVEPTMAYAEDFRRAVWSELSGENDDELIKLFLNWDNTREQPSEMEENSQASGTNLKSNGEIAYIMECSDAEEYIRCIREELPYRNTEGPEEDVE